MKKYNVISRSLYSVSVRKKYIRYFMYFLGCLFIVFAMYVHLLQWYRWHMLSSVCIMRIDNDTYKKLCIKRKNLEMQERHLHQQMVKHDKLRMQLKKQQRLLQVLVSKDMIIESFLLEKNTCDLYCTLPLYADAKKIIKKFKQKELFDKIKLVSFSQKGANCHCHIHGVLL
jgi:hypothetical protein